MSQPEVMVRPEYVTDNLGEAATGDVARRLTLFERLSNMDVVRKFTILLFLVVAWELYTRASKVSELILPKFSSTFSALVEAIRSASEPLLYMIANSMVVLLTGYFIGLAIATLLTTAATMTRFGSDLLSTLTAMLNPLPAIALLPLALLWFGLGPDAIVFTLLHSVIWPVALSAHTGFMSVSETQRMVGRNYGLKGIFYVAKLLIPAAFPSILMGMKIAWAFAWRTLIAAELVFGISIGENEGNTSGGLGWFVEKASQGVNAIMDLIGIPGADNASGGLGWFVYKNQEDLQIAYVFAGLFAVILVGVLVENLVFNTIEKRTVRKWGMQVQ